MYVDKYRVNQSKIDEKLKLFDKYIKDYTDKVSLLKNKVEEINNSGLWVDANVKTEFINLCKQYIVVYEQCISSMNELMNYAIRKTSQQLDIEHGYAKRISNE